MGLKEEIIYSCYKNIYNLKIVIIFYNILLDYYIT
jgi:hypothetical protein